MSGLNKQIFENSKFKKVVDLRQLTIRQSEMKSILRAKSTPDIVRLQLQRTIKLIDEILSEGQQFTKVKRDIEVQSAKKIRKKLKSVKLSYKNTG